MSQQFNISQYVIPEVKQMCEEMKDITIKGETVTLRGVMKDSDIPALEALADSILA